MKSRCNLCQNETESQLLYEVKGFPIVRCAECGLVFVEPSSVTDELLAKIYSPEYFEGGVEDGYADYGNSEAVLRKQAACSLRTLRKYQAGGRLLEIGCAYGYFLKEAAKFFTAEGIELSDHAAARARQDGLDVRTGDFVATPFPAGHYDAVCIFACMEHLRDPFGYLQKIHNVLRQGGVLMLSTCDIASTYARISGKKWRAMTPPQHLMFYSRDTLRKMLEKAGFEVLDESWPWQFVPLSLVLYQISPRLRSAFGFLSKYQIGVYANLFDAIFVVARKR